MLHSGGISFLTPLGPVTTLSAVIYIDIGSVLMTSDILITGIWSQTNSLACNDPKLSQVKSTCEDLDTFAHSDSNVILTGRQPRLG